MPDKEKKVRAEKKAAEMGTPKAETNVEVSPVAPATPPIQRPNRPGLFGNRTGASNPVESPVFVLAETTGTNPVVFAALKTAYGWTDKTKLTKDGFLQLRGEWLRKPAKEA